TSWSLKAASIMILDMGIGFTVGSLIGFKFMEVVKKTNFEFTSKMNKEFKETYEKNSVEINRSLFGSADLYMLGEEDRTFIKPRFKFSSDYTKADKLKLDSYETVKKRYIDIQEESRRQEEQNRQERGLLSFLSSFRREASA
ncbi:MAG: hypothetical protein K1060chlam4_01591, partial [Candidatus Anoxychlamydiales bacterium]|nr:hypothetical protein [Candidatus Anoxychlamydiales bacterium]